MARATAAAVPAITTCPGALRLAGLTTSPSAASRHACSTFVGVEAENRRHRAGADRHGLLHVAAAIADDADGIGEREGAGGDVRGILAEAVTRDHVGLEPARARAADTRQCSW